jgi:hypothetical protein
MAMFSGETTTITTPDGRTLVLPKEVAAQFPGLAPGPAPMPPPQALAPSGPVLPEETPAASPVPPPPIAPPAAQGPPQGPVTSPDQVPSGGRPMAPRGPVTQPGPEQGTQPVTEAPARPIRTLDEAKQAAASASQGQERAMAGEEAAVQRSAQVEADTATKQGEILAARDAQTQKILEEKARIAAENHAALEAKMAARDAYAAKIANTKVDRSIDHPVLAAIGIALGGLGAAMQQKAYGGAFHNQAFDAVMQGVKDKVAAQMADLDNQRAALAQMNVGIGEQRMLGQDRLTEESARLDGALQQAKQQVDTIATQMKAPGALAQADILKSKIDVEIQKNRESFADRSQAQLNTEAALKQKAASEAAARSLQYKMHTETLQAQKEEKMAEVSARLLAEGKASAAAKADKAAQTVLYDPRTREVMLTPQGQKKFAQADQIEALARQNPAVPALDYIKTLRAQAKTDDEKKQIDQLELRVKTDPQFANKAAHEYAAAIRDDARINDGVHAADPKVAERLKPKIKGAQDLTEQIDDVQKMLEGDPATWDREKWAGIATKMGNIANEYQGVIGERISVRAFEQTMKHILEFNPDSLFDRTASKERALESLKELQGIVNGKINNELGSEGIKTDWRPIPRSEAERAPEFGDQTAAEIGQSAQPGRFARLGARIVTGGTHSYNDLDPRVGAEAEMKAETAEGAEAGLSKTAVEAVRGLSARADRVGDKERNKIVEVLKDKIGTGLAEGGRSSLANGMLEIIRTSNPRLYGEILAQLPQEQAEQIQRADAARAALTPNLPPPNRAPSGFDPDKAAAASAEQEREANKQRARRAYEEEQAARRNNRGVARP